VSATTRASLVNYMMHVALRLHIPNSALFAGVDLLDRFLAARPDLAETDLLVRTATGACLCIAAKLQSRRASLIRLSAFAPGVDGVDGRVMQEAEMAVLQALDFRVSGIVTIYDVLHQLLQRLLLPLDEDVACMAEYLAHLALLDATFLRFAPSVTAAACLECALGIMRPAQDAVTVAACAALLRSCCHGLPPGRHAQQSSAVQLMRVVACKADQAATAGNPYVATTKLWLSTGIMVRP
jgi:cyclin A